MEAATKDASGLLSGASLATLLFTIALTLCIKYITDLFRRNPRHVSFAKTLSGPPTLPFFGNGYVLIDHADEAFKLLEKYKQEYGSIYPLWFGKHLVLGTTDIKFIETVLGSSKNLDKPLFMIDAATPIWGAENVFSAHTPLWKKSRKELQTFFTKNSLSEKLPHINSLVKKYVGKLEKRVDGPEFNVGDMLDLLSFDVITEVLLNASLECPEEDLIALTKSFRAGDEILFEKMFKPWLNNGVMNFILYRKRIREFKATTNNFFKKVLDGQMISTKPESEAETPFIQLLNRLSCALGLGENYIKEECILMIAAGNVTTATTASYALLMLAMNSEIQEKVYAEIIEKLGHEDREPDINELNNFTYLDQVLKETERRFLLVPFIFRHVRENLGYGQHKIPAGTAVMIVNQAIHQSPEYYKNPEEFDPDHFSAEAIAKRPKLAFFPFSSGARNCLGKPLAENTLRLILINFIRRFKFTTNEKMHELKHRAELVMHLEGGYKVMVQRRDV